MEHQTSNALDETILEARPIRRRSPWVVIVDAILPVVPLFWALVDLVESQIARMRRAESTPPGGHRV